MSTDSSEHASPDLKEIILQDLASGQHSQSLVEYTKSTTWGCVFAVCSLALSLAFALSILLYRMPLRPPSEGWAANKVFWIRLSIDFFASSFEAVNMLRLAIPASGLMPTRTLIIAVGGTIGPFLQALVLAQTWRFPTPFSIVLVGPIWQVSVHFCFFLVIGSKKRRENPDIVKQLKDTIPS